MHRLRLFRLFHVLICLGLWSGAVQALTASEASAIAVGETDARLEALAKATGRSPVDGVVEMVSTVTGQVTLREPPIPVQIDAYLDGVVEEVLPREGVVIRTEGAFIQGIFGVGGETQGVVRVAVNGPDDILDENCLEASDKGKVVVGGSLVTFGAIKKAEQVGAVGLVAGGIIAVVAMSIAILLALRPRWPEQWLGGLDKMYRLHKWLGITALATQLWLTA